VNFNGRDNHAGYRTARGSEGDKNSTNHNDEPSLIVVSKCKANPDFSLSPYPARYRERFCTSTFVGFVVTDSSDSWTTPVLGFEM
jgi:hypothetical protein